MGQSIERVETVGVVIGDLMVDVAVRIWEPENSQASVTCAHGFAGTSEDFAPLAETLTQSGITVIAPDMLGRGKSTFFLDPKYYTLRNQMFALAISKRYQKPKACFLGTSWGGLMLLGHLASSRWACQGVVLNDCPLEANATVNGFREQLQQEAMKLFPTRDAAEAYLLESRSMGFLSGPWRDRFIQSRLLEIEGGWRMNYDPTLSDTLRTDNPFSVVDLLKGAPCPVLMSFGAESPYALDPKNDEVAEANPNITLIKTMSDPHPPSLMKQDQIYTLAGFFARCFSQP